jgi:nitronate monooxygenase
VIVSSSSEIGTNPKLRLRALINGLRLPLMAAPMTIATSRKLVTAACASGVIGCVHARNAQRDGGLRDWIDLIVADLEDVRVKGGSPAPFAINLAVSRQRPAGELADEIEVCRSIRAPIVTTNSGDPGQVVEAVHSWGGAVIHDVTSEQHAERAIAAGVDGLMLVTAGAGGQGGLLSPFAFVSRLRANFDGVIVLAGGIADGSGIAAARVLGADLVCMGTRFIATQESGAPEGHKAMLTTATLADVKWTEEISGSWANFLRPSIVAAGLDPDTLPPLDPNRRPTTGRQAKAWSTVWSGGHSVGAIDDVPPVSHLIDRLEAQYRGAMARASLSNT